MAEVQTRTVEADEAGMRLDRWFQTHFPEVAFSYLQKLLRSGQVRVDGRRVKSNTRLEGGQAVRIPPLARSAEPASGGARKGGGEAAGSEPAGDRPVRAPRPKRENPLRDAIIHEDESVFVFNKPAGVAVQGGSGITTHVDALLEDFRDRKGQKPRLVHRLDRETSGVLVVAKTRLAASKLAASFRARTTRKVYWALVAGVPKPRQGRVSTFLAREEGEERMRIAEHGEDEASHAVSLYSVVDVAGPKLAWLTMRPVTGRTHQLRAHAAHIGHPIVGDPRYFEKKDWELPGGLQNRLHLHARRILIPHPDGGRLDATAPLPPHMVQAWNLLGFDPTLGDTGSDEGDE